MRISGTESSLVILSQTKSFQNVKIDVQKVPKQPKVKRDGVINPQNYNFSQFNTENFDALKHYESTEVDHRTWLHAPSETHWSTRLTSSFAAKQLSPLTRLMNVHVFPELLDDVADRISRQYLHLGLELGFPVDRIEQFRLSNRTNTLELIRDMLREWMTNNHPSDRDKIGSLATALLNARCDISCLFDWEETILKKFVEQTRASSSRRRKCVIL